MCPQIPFYPNTKLGEISTFKNCRLLSSFRSYEWQVANWKLNDQANLSPAFIFLLLFFRKPQELHQQFLSFFSCGWFGQTMVPTHFAVLTVFIFPHEKPAKITAEDGVGKEMSHKSIRLPVVHQKDTAAEYYYCTSKVENQSYVICLFPWNTIWVNRNISHRGQNSYAIAFYVMNYCHLLTFPPGRKRVVDQKNISKKKHQAISVHSTPWNRPWNRITSFWSSKKINGETRVTSKISVFRPNN